MLAFVSLMLLGTLALGYNDVQKKKLISEGMDDQIVLCLSFLGTGVLVGLVCVATGVPVIQAGFWSAAAGTVVLNLVSQNLLIRAMALDDISLIAPLRLMTPLLVVLTGFLFLHETPTLLGVGGIVVTMAGLYLLLQPSLRRRGIGRGVLYGAAAAALFAVSFPLDKIAVATSSASFMTATVFVTIGVVTTFWHWRRDHSFITRLAVTVRQTPRASLCMVAVGSVGFVLTNQALLYALVAYASSLKRLQALWTVLFARVRLKEADTGHRLLAVAVILAGILMTVLAR